MNCESGYFTKGFDKKHMQSWQWLIWIKKIVMTLPVHPLILCQQYPANPSMCDLCSEKSMQQMTSVQLMDNSFLCPNNENLRKHVMINIQKKLKLKIFPEIWKLYTELLPRKEYVQGAVKWIVQDTNSLLFWKLGKCSNTWNNFLNLLPTFFIVALYLLFKNTCSQMLYAVCTQ